ncbi:MAG: tetratricopeptide repeat protein [bacterium]
MATTRCTICGVSKAKRICHAEKEHHLCPVCCAKTRSDACGGCAHHRAADKYRSDQRQERKFIALLDPVLDDECDDALSLIESGNLAQGEARIQALFKRRPDYHMVQYGMGVCCIQRKNFGEAADCFRRAVEIFPYFTEAYFNLGMVCLTLLDLSGMIAAFREVVRVGGDDELVAEARERIDDFERHVRKHSGISLDAFLKNEETFVTALQKLEAGEYSDASELFNRVLSVEPNHMQSWGNLGLAYAGLGEKARALECLNKALEIDPDYEVAIVNKALVERLDQGERIEGNIESIDYTREYRAKKKKSYIADTLRWMQQGTEGE